MNESQEYSWYNLKYSIAEFMVPKLEEYRCQFISAGVSIPKWVSEEFKEPYSDRDIETLNKLWIADLDKMIYSFKMVLNYNTGNDESIPYNERDIQEGVELFAKHFQHLWD